MCYAVVGRLYLLKVLDVPKVMRCVLLEVLDMFGGAGDDAPCAALFAGGSGGWAQFRGFEISIVSVFSSQSATVSLTAEDMPCLAAQASGRRSVWNFTEHDVVEKPWVAQTVGFIPLIAAHTNG